MSTDNFKYNPSEKSSKLVFLFGIFLLAIIIFAASTLNTIFSDRDLPSHTAIIHDRSIRGSIISSDGYVLAKSQKTYQASVRAESINPPNRRIFVTLFSLYSGIKKQDIARSFSDKYGNHIYKGRILLSSKLDARHAAQLKSLAQKLRKLNVFIPMKKKNGVEIVYGLDVIENEETRVFPLGTTLTPLIGYTGKYLKNEYVRPIGKQGLERRYESYIAFKNNGKVTGKRDVTGDVVRNRLTSMTPRINGLDLHLNVSVALQKRMEKILDEMKNSSDSDEAIAVVMESKSGKIAGIASSNRFIPNHITKNDINSLNPKFSEYLYEPGSVLKPFTLAIALEHKKVTPETVFNLFGGSLDIGGKRPITDGDHRYESLSATDIIVHSSNVGISLISWLVTGQQFHDGLIKFGLTKPSGIDLSRDLAGKIKSSDILEKKLYRANSSYGYGLMVSFMQLFKAYAAFNNDGIIPKPHIVDYFQDINGDKYILPSNSNIIQAISKQTASQIQNILIKTVNEGTGYKAKTTGLIIGGKTGTAKMVVNGRYKANQYQSSFFGFVNDNYGHKYTIGALVINPKKSYYASDTAVPVVKGTIDTLVELGYIKRNPSAVQEEQLEEEAKSQQSVTENVPQSIID
jgi:cell division protein FtsI (penicillin-binding protein 3)